ncbi:hypothetical protein [Gracilimonas mengyeensis]|uniref:Uncharacterized protein n=1 Tax=Gracilimonas mengyeensis TaxID=1302730 RepID=A0A521BIJ3_9BACT|nr:hypothetical protein [Gracilimonas mengyeensis]SMO46886.1 hypothetical protein SAMN06265219_102308 [Gracilimonas mengyeensis]
MHASRGYILVLLFLIMGFVMGSCGLLGSDGPSNTITITALDAQTNEPLDSLAIYINGKLVKENVSTYTLTKNKGTTVTIKIVRNGYIAETKEVKINADKPIRIPLVRQAPDKVTLSYAIIANDTGTLDNVELLVNDEVVARDSDGSIALPSSRETVTVCATAAYYEASCDTLASLIENRNVELKLERKRVRIAITPEVVGYTDYSESWDTGNGTPTRPGYVRKSTVYVLQIGDSTWTEIGREVKIADLPVDIPSTSRELELGEGVESTITYPAGPEELEVRLWVQYFPKEGHEYSDNAYLNVAEGSIKLSGDTDSNITLNLDHIPACSDGIDNDFYDGIDTADPGCIDPETGIHDPENDVELMRTRTHTHYILSEDTHLVSGKQEEQRVRLLPVRSLDHVAKIAQSFTIEFTTFAEGSQTGEDFAIELHTGPSQDNLVKSFTSSIIPDDGLDGWRIVQIHDLTKESFANGTYYKIIAVHAANLAGITTDGNDDVVFYEANLEDYLAIKLDYQPEHVPKAKVVIGATAADLDVDVTISDVGPKTDIRR